MLTSVYAAALARVCVCVCALCTSAPRSVSGSLLVCRVDSPWTRRYRLYLTLNDPPERVMRERWRGVGREDGLGGGQQREKDEI